MATSAKVGLLIPTSFGVAPPKLAEYTEFFRQADDLGFHSIWVIYRIFHQINILDPLTVLTSAATVTLNVRLGTAILLFAFRNPVLTAKATATLDYLSGGRLTLGISLGGRDNEFEALGLPIKQRVSRFRENLAVMRQLWAEQHVTFHGRYYHLDNVSMEPKPVQKPGIPIILGGSAEAVLQRSAEEADGWVAGGAMNAEAFGEAWQKVSAYAVAAGKDPDHLDSGKLMYITVGEDREWCKQRLRTYTHAYYGSRYDVDNNCVYGPPDECAAKIQRFIDSGAKTLILGPPWPDLDQAARIANEVVPLLR